jgi:hypothetical protein
MAPQNPTIKFLTSPLTTFAPDICNVGGAVTPEVVDDPVLAALPELFLDPVDNPVVATASVDEADTSPRDSEISVGSTLAAVVCIAASLVDEPPTADFEVAGEPVDSVTVPDLIVVGFVEASTPTEVLVGTTADVTTAVAAFCQTETTHCDANLLSMNLPFCFVGVKLRV